MKKLTHTWQKSTRSDNSGPYCVEVRRNATGGVDLRDSKNPAGPVLSFTEGEWEAFRAGVTDGEFQI